MKEQNHNAVKMFSESEIKITLEGKQRLGVVIGSKTFKISPQNRL